MINSIYISGPLGDYESTSVDKRLDNVHRAVKAADDLTKAGFTPYIPHLSYWWNVESSLQRTKTQWLRMDLYWIGKCDAMLRLSGPSSGSDIEEAYALALRKPVYLSMEPLLELAKVQSQAMQGAAELGQGVMSRALTMLEQGDTDSAKVLLGNGIELMQGA